MNKIQHVLQILQEPLKRLVFVSHLYQVFRNCYQPLPQQILFVRRNQQVTYIKWNPSWEKNLFLKEVPRMFHISRSFSSKSGKIKLSKNNAFSRISTDKYHLLTCNNRKKIKQDDKLIMTLRRDNNDFSVRGNHKVLDLLNKNKNGVNLNKIKEQGKYIYESIVDKLSKPPVATVNKLNKCSSRGILKKTKSKNDVLAILEKKREANTKVVSKEKEASNSNEIVSFHDLSEVGPETVKNAVMVVENCKEHQIMSINNSKLRRSERDDRSQRKRYQEKTNSFIMTKENNNIKKSAKTKLFKKHQPKIDYHLKKLAEKYSKSSVGKTLQKLQNEYTNGTMKKSGNEDVFKKLDIKKKVFKHDLKKKISTDISKLANKSINNKYITSKPKVSLSNVLNNTQNSLNTLPKSVKDTTNQNYTILKVDINGDLKCKNPKELQDPKDPPIEMTGNSESIKNNIENYSNPVNLSIPASRHNNDSCNAKATDIILNDETNETMNGNNKNVLVININGILDNNISSPTCSNETCSKENSTKNCLNQLPLLGNGNNINAKRNSDLMNTKRKTSENIVLWKSNVIPIQVNEAKISDTQESPSSQSPSSINSNKEETNLQVNVNIEKLKKNANLLPQCNNINQSSVNKKHISNGELSNKGIALVVVKDISSCNLNQVSKPNNNHENNQINKIDNINLFNEMGKKPDKTVVGNSHTSKGTHLLDKSKMKHTLQEKNLSESTSFSAKQKDQINNVILKIDKLSMGMVKNLNISEGHIVPLSKSKNNECTSASDHLCLTKLPDKSKETSVVNKNIEQKSSLAKDNELNTSYLNSHKYKSQSKLELAKNIISKDNSIMDKNKLSTAVINKVGENSKALEQNKTLKETVRTITINDKHKTGSIKKQSTHIRYGVALDLTVPSQNKNKMGNEGSINLRKMKKSVESPKEEITKNKDLITNVSRYNDCNPKTNLLKMHIDTNSVHQKLNTNMKNSNNIRINTASNILLKSSDNYIETDEYKITQFVNLKCIKTLNILKDLWNKNVELPLSQRTYLLPKANNLILISSKNKINIDKKSIADCLKVIKDIEIKDVLYINPKLLISDLPSEIVGGNNLYKKNLNSEVFMLLVSQNGVNHALFNKIIDLLSNSSLSSCAGRFSTNHQHQPNAWHESQDFVEKGNIFLMHSPNKVSLPRVLKPTMNEIKSHESKLINDTEIKLVQQDSQSQDILKEEELKTMLASHESSIASREGTVEKQNLESSDKRHSSVSSFLENESCSLQVTTKPKINEEKVPSKIPHIINTKQMSSYSKYTNTLTESKKSSDFIHLINSYISGYKLGNAASITGKPEIGHVISGKNVVISFSDLTSFVKDKKENCLRFERRQNLSNSGKNTKITKDLLSTVTNLPNSMNHNKELEQTNGENKLLLRNEDIQQKFSKEISGKPLTAKSHTCISSTFLREGTVPSRVSEDAVRKYVNKLKSTSVELKKNQKNDPDDRERRGTPLKCCNRDSCIVKESGHIRKSEKWSPTKPGQLIAYSKYSSEATIPCSIIDKNIRDTINLNEKNSSANYSTINDMKNASKSVEGKNIGHIDLHKDYNIGGNAHMLEINASSREKEGDAGFQLNIKYTLNAAQVLNSKSENKLANPIRSIVKLQPPTLKFQNFLGNKNTQNFKELVLLIKKQDKFSKIQEIIKYNKRASFEELTRMIDHNLNTRKFNKSELKEIEIVPEKKYSLTQNQTKGSGVVLINENKQPALYKELNPVPAVHNVDQKNAMKPLEKCYQKGLVNEKKTTVLLIDNQQKTAQSKPDLTIPTEIIGENRTVYDNNLSKRRPINILKEQNDNSTLSKQKLKTETYQSSNSNARNADIKEVRNAANNILLGLKQQNVDSKVTEAKETKCNSIVSLVKKNANDIKISEVADKTKELEEMTQKYLNQLRKKKTVTTLSSTPTMNKTNIKNISGRNIDYDGKSDECTLKEKDKAYKHFEEILLSLNRTGSDSENKNANSNLKLSMANVLSPQFSEGDSLTIGETLPRIKLKSDGDSSNKSELVITKTETHQPEKTLSNSILIKPCIRQKLDIDIKNSLKPGHANNNVGLENTKTQNGLEKKNKNALLIENQNGTTKSKYDCIIPPELLDGNRTVYGKRNAKGGSTKVIKEEIYNSILQNQQFKTYHNQDSKSKVLNSLEEDTKTANDILPLITIQNINSKKTEPKEMKYIETVPLAKNENIKLNIINESNNSKSILEEDEMKLLKGNSLKLSPSRFVKDQTDKTMKTEEDVVGNILNIITEETTKTPEFKNKMPSNNKIKLNNEKQHSLSTNLDIQKPQNMNPKSKESLSHYSKFLNSPQRANVRVNNTCEQGQKANKNFFNFEVTNKNRRRNLKYEEPWCHTTKQVKIKCTSKLIHLVTNQIKNIPGSRVKDPATSKLNPVEPQRIYDQSSSVPRCRQALQCSNILEEGQIKQNSHSRKHSLLNKEDNEGYLSQRLRSEPSASPSSILFSGNTCKKENKANTTENINIIISKYKHNRKLRGLKANKLKYNTAKQLKYCLLTTPNRDNVYLRQNKNNLLNEGINKDNLNIFDNSHNTCIRPHKNKLPINHFGCTTPSTEVHKQRNSMPTRNRRAYDKCLQSIFDECGNQNTGQQKEYISSSALLDTHAPTQQMLSKTLYIENPTNRECFKKNQPEDEDVKNVLHKDALSETQHSPIFVLHPSTEVIKDMENPKNKECQNFGTSSVILKDPNDISSDHKPTNDNRTNNKCHDVVKLENNILNLGKEGELTSLVGSVVSNVKNKLQRIPSTMCKLMAQSQAQRISNIVKHKMFDDFTVSNFQQKLKDLQTNMLLNKTSSEYFVLKTDDHPTNNELKEKMPMDVVTKAGNVNTMSVSQDTHKLEHSLEEANLKKLNEKKFKEKKKTTTDLTNKKVYESVAEAMIQVERNNAVSKRRSCPHLAYADLLSDLYQKYVQSKPKNL